ncbi:MAG: hypothetical protein ABWZ80_10060, partial [Beijerinckiaceae bacterium]
NPRAAAHRTAPERVRSLADAPEGGRQLPAARCAAEVSVRVGDFAALSGRATYATASPGLIGT